MSSENVIVGGLVSIAVAAAAAGLDWALKRGERQRAADSDKRKDLRLEIEALWTRIDDLEDRAAKQAAEHEQKYTALWRQHQELQMQFSAMQQQQAGLIIERDKLQRCVNDLQAQLQTAQADGAARTERIRELEARLQVLESDHDAA